MDIDQQVFLHRIKHDSPGLGNIAKAYRTPLRILVPALAAEKMILWAISQDGRDVGLLQLDRYNSVTELQRQITDADLAQQVFNQGYRLEASAFIAEGHRGKGLGSKIVRACVNDPRFNNIFQVVDCDNQASNRMLQKNGFQIQGTYQWRSLLGRIFCCFKIGIRHVNVYVFSPRALVL
jgi:RimJ/RimL family protein N-acetyltransferase